MALLYKGYAQQKGFDPIDVPDPSKKIREQGLRDLEGMQAQLNWNKRQADRINSQLAQNALVEDRVRTENWQLRRAHRDVIVEGERRQHQQILDNLQTKQKNAQQKRKELEQIIEFVGTLPGHFKDIDDKRKADADLWA